MTKAFWAPIAIMSESPVRNPGISASTYAQYKAKGRVFPRHTSM